MWEAAPSGASQNLPVIYDKIKFDLVSYVQWSLITLIFYSDIDAWFYNTSKCYTAEDHGVYVPEVQKEEVHDVEIPWFPVKDWTMKLGSTIFSELYLISEIVFNTFWCWAKSNLAIFLLKKNEVFSTFTD